MTGTIEVVNKYAIEPNPDTDIYIGRGSPLGNPFSHKEGWKADFYATYLPLHWAVIGAASDGATKYQPVGDDADDLIRLLDKYDVPVFMKGNLDWTPFREEYPNVR